MKARILLPIMMCIGTPAYAQISAYQGSPSLIVEPPRMNIPVDSGSYLWLGDRSITPTMRRDRFVRALSLRDEVIRLQAEDGGVLSAEHVRYVRRESAKILGRWPSMTGTMTGKISSTMIKSCPTSGLAASPPTC